MQQEYQALFESPAGDPDAVMRWRNRALRFVLASDSDLPACHKLDAPTGKHGALDHRNSLLCDYVQLPETLKFVPWSRAQQTFSLQLCCLKLQ